MTGQGGAHQIEVTRSPVGPRHQDQHVGGGRRPEPADAHLVVAGRRGHPVGDGRGFHHRRGGDGEHRLGHRGGGPEGHRPRAGGGRRRRGRAPAPGQHRGPHHRHQHRRGPSPPSSHGTPPVSGAACLQAGRRYVGTHQPDHQPLVHQSGGHPLGPFPVAGPPGGCGQIVRGHRTPPQGVDQAAPALPVRAVEAGLAGGHAGRPGGRIGSRSAGSGPTAAAADRAVATRRGAGCAQAGPQVEEGLVEGPAPAGRHHGVDQPLGLGRRHRPAGGGPGQYPAGVGVDHADIGFEGEGDDGPGGVGTDPGQGQQVGQGRRHPTAVLLHHRPGGQVETAGATVVPEPLPGAEDLPQGGGGARGRIGKAVEEPVVGRYHPGQLGLLGHHLADQHRPRVTGAPPRQFRPPRAATIGRPPRVDGPTQPGQTAPVGRPVGGGGAGPGRHRPTLTPRRRPRRAGGGAGRRPASTPSPCGGRSRPPRRAG